MTEHDHDDLRRLFDLAIAAPADERDALLEDACGGDADLRRRVTAMIAAAEDDSFLAAPTAAETRADLPSSMCRSPCRICSLPSGRSRPRSSRCAAAPRRRTRSGGPAASATTDSDERSLEGDKRWCDGE
jgi:hypothetical protein